MHTIEPMIAAGIDVGLIRSYRSLPGFNVGNLEALRNELTREVIPIIGGYTSNRPWGPRGQATYAEMFAMGAVARLHYKEGRMAVDVAAGVLDPLTRFLNSWLHE